MINIVFKNLTKSEVDEQPLLVAIRQFLPKYGITDNVEVELNIVGHDRMKRLNRIYRQRDYATDVLSFPIWHNLEAIKANQEQISLGSVVICLPVAIQQAKAENISLTKTMVSLTEHSLLHLIGIHHEGDN